MFICHCIAMNVEIRMS
ncbi:hypothetical protein F383_23004 [Gossypium arboreum]|uniref:Uncharacterized protein n=1 Tax=Gossypium arboreum TaxID=29729 RepID=A0A0B0NXW0_GOSAR|nr:hypothetical protein F383_23004 [Gossypium arboreum]